MIADRTKIKILLSKLGELEKKIKEKNITQMIDQHLPILIPAYSPLYEGQYDNEECSYSLGVGEGELYTLKVLECKGESVGVKYLLDQRIDFESTLFNSNIIDALERILEKTNSRLKKYTL